MYTTLLLLIACRGDKNEDTAIDTGTQITSEDSAETGSTTPEPPEPFQLTISGTDNESLSFDTPTCQIPNAVPNFNLYWRLASGAHKFVLRVFINADYVGAGEYENSTQNISVRLQEEAGGSGRFYQSDLAQGDAVTASIETDDDNNVWGTVSISTMHNGESSISLEPTSFPIWCSQENTN